MGPLNDAAAVDAFITIQLKFVIELVHEQGDSKSQLNSLIAGNVDNVVVVVVVVVSTCDVAKGG